MNNRERTLAILNYQEYDRLPLVHFGYWEETIEKWCDEGHITPQEAKDVWDGSPNENLISSRLGFDFNWYRTFQPKSGMSMLNPLFESKVVEELPDGYRKILSPEGALLLEKVGARSIPPEIDHLLKGRAEWEEFFLPKLQYSEDRIDMDYLMTLKDDNRENPYGIFLGSLFGQIRNWLGIEGISYLYIDDEELYNEIIDTVGNLSFKVAEKIFSSGVKFDFAHFWEDICFKNGPLVSPVVFDEKVGPHYKKLTDLAKSYGVGIISLDCDGVIDSLIPTWIENGVNTMFPIEVGTWGANIAPWREKYGKVIRGVGGMNKSVFAFDYKAIDAEIERLKPLIELGGFIPCPDHRIAPDAKWENVQYYCSKMHEIFG